MLESKYLYWVQGSSLDFAVALCSTAALPSIQHLKVDNSYHTPVIVTNIVTLVAIFAPMASLLADIKYSRYQTVVCSSCTLLITVTILFLVLGVLGIIDFLKLVPHCCSYNRAVAMGTIPLTVVVILLCTVFIVNAIQFGMDQLHDSPTDDSVLFIHWYVWVNYLCSFIASLMWNLLTYDVYFRDIKIVFSGVVICLFLIIVGQSVSTFSLCMTKYKSIWFHFEPAGVNPYKLVYAVVKFTFKHKVPLRRSAFTYCGEDEFPSGMDLGKQKYGGPFTTKQVEDVKAFWGILKVVSSLGPMFMLQVAQSMLPVFAKHSNMYILNSTVKQEIHLEGKARHLFISNGLLSPLLVVVFIPVYLCWIKPRLSYHIPGSLKRVGLGIVVMILSLAAALAMDVVVHKKNSGTWCMFSGIVHHNWTTSNHYQNISPLLYQNAYYFISQNLLAAAMNVLVDIAVLEFICSQSPYSMKGLIFGLFFSIRSLFEAVAVIFVILFGMTWHVKELSCGSGFYLMNIIIGLLELALFAFVARRYKYRTVNEPSNEYQYAEEYYSNIR